MLPLAHGKFKRGADPTVTEAVESLAQRLFDVGNQIVDILDAD